MKFNNFQEILAHIDNFDPKLYGHTRNFIDGNVSYLSPYISRGIISTKMIYNRILTNGHTFQSAEKFIQELAWRDYWQQIWLNKGNAIDYDFKNPQPKANFEGIPHSILNAQTGIEAIDSSIKELYETGYMHNHLRMYLASIVCNVAQCHWSIPARWMYYHLLDGDWASNALSWQWVAGANSNKLYYANQENINKYTYSKQKNTFLDTTYEVLMNNNHVPEVLNEKNNSILSTNLSLFENDIILNEDLPLVLYNHYNLDAEWLKDIEANRVLILEPSFYEKYPVSDKVIEHILFWASKIPNIQIFKGTFEALQQQFQGTIHFKEHPTNSHYKGIEHPRVWMFEVKGYFPSFFAFWKKCLKSIQ